MTLDCRVSRRASSFLAMTEEKDLQNWMQDKFMRKENIQK
jgi:hypothetical protein